MKSRNYSIVFLTLAAFITGFCVMSAIRANNIQVARQTDPRNEELIRSITALEAEISELEEKRRLINERITEFHASQAEEESQLSLLRANLENIRQNAALTELIGPGLSVIIDDNKEGADKARSSSPETFFPENYIVHDKDLLYLVRALAPLSEAISINNVRLNDSSHIRCAGTVILVNYTILAPPYEIRAIGDPEVLTQALTSSSRYQTLLNKMMPLKVTATQELTLSGYSGTYALSYSKAAKESTPGSL